MIRNTSKLLWFSISMAAYFLTIFLLYYYRVSWVLVGVFQEMLTLPLMVAQMVLLVFVLKRIFRHDGRTTGNLIALILSLATTILILQSF